MAQRIYDPIYQDANTIVSPGFSRIRGELELIMLFASFYEYTDVRLYFIQQFRGLNTIFYPSWFNSYIILPEELINYRYSNQYTGLNYQIDWLNNGAQNLLIKTTNKNELVYPCTIRPQMKMTSMSDGSERYGGTDNLASWRLNATIEYEVELPTYLILQSDYLVENLKLNLTVGSMFSNYDPNNNIPEAQLIQKRHWDLGLDETSHSIVMLDDATSVINYEKDFIFKDKYVHTIDASQTDSTSDILINLPIVVNDENELIVRDKYGIMDFNVYYEIIQNGSILKIFSEHVKYDLGDIIELFYYQSS